jgi:asparagine synthase (glutamine-hydrolysing)
MSAGMPFNGIPRVLEKAETIMCGFLSYIGREPLRDAAMFDAARDRLAHRGPDAARSMSLRDGRVRLGHRRLSILDLSEAGHQPMRLGDVWVIYNGEIYNFPELRRELEQKGSVFASHCDTEVLLHGYRAWGADLPRRLVGMFAFCLWDDATGELLAARDHAGQKPLYYTWDGDRFMAASEVKALVPLMARAPTLRRESIVDFLVYDDIPDPYTWHREINSVPPGHVLTMSFDRERPAPRVSAYWTFTPDAQPAPADFTRSRDALGALLERSVRMHQLADVEVGAFLSGGLDSSAVVALEASQRQDPVRTFTVGYTGETGELPLARLVAEHCGCRHTEAMLEKDGMDAAFGRSFGMFDMPFGDPSQFPTYEVSRLAARDLKVVLTGDGGDEVFGGYWDLKKYMGDPPVDSWNPFAHIRHWRQRTERRRTWQATYNFGHSPAAPELIRTWLGPELADLRDYDGWWFYKQHWRQELDPFRRAQWLDFKTYLPTVLKKVDRCAMAHSLEARCPILHTELIEFAFNLPTEVKNPRGEFKYLYREWMRARRLVPDALFRAPKLGFGVAHPAAGHIRRDPVMMSHLESAIRAGWFNDKAHADAPAYWSRVWRFALIAQALKRD